MHKGKIKAKSVHCPGNTGHLTFIHVQRGGEAPLIVWQPSALRGCFSSLYHGYGLQPSWKTENWRRSGNSSCFGACQNVHRLQYSPGQLQLEVVTHQMFSISTETARLPLHSYWVGIHIIATISSCCTEYYVILLPAQLLGPSSCDLHLLFWATTHTHTQPATTSPKELIIQRNKRFRERKQSRINLIAYSRRNGMFMTEAEKETFCITEVFTSLAFSQYSMYWTLRLLLFFFPCLTQSQLHC